MTDRPLLPTVVLEKGAHDAKSGKLCAMEYAAYLAGEKHSDHPECVSPVIAEFMRSWNDALPDAQRHILKPWIPQVLHTRTSDADETTRAWLCTDWLVRVQTPAWLDLAGLHERATELRNLPALTSSEVAVAVQSVIEHARADAGAACDAARDAAWAAAWAAARDAARDAAWDPAWDAARDAARAAAWAAARDAARDAAREKLAPTVTLLQASAFELLDRMIAVGQTREPGLACVSVGEAQQEHV